MTCYLLTWISHKIALRVPMHFTYSRICMQCVLAWLTLSELLKNERKQRAHQLQLSLDLQCSWNPWKVEAIDNVDIARDSGLGLGEWRITYLVVKKQQLHLAQIHLIVYKILTIWIYPAFFNAMVSRNEELHRKSVINFMKKNANRTTWLHALMNRLYRLMNRLLTISRRRFTAGDLNGFLNFVFRSHAWANHFEMIMFQSFNSLSHKSSVY